MKQLWSCSTTMRNPERAYHFLCTIAEMENREWTKSAQKELQIRLIKNRHYYPTKIDILPTKLKKAFYDLSHKLTLQEAADIFNAQNYQDAPMRGRTSFDPIEKMGLVALNDNKITITDTGKRFLDGNIEIGDVMLAYLLKFQYPNPLMQGFSDFNVKPFVCALRLIKCVNEFCEKNHQKAKGISKLEFGIYALSITDYKNIEKIAIELLSFRRKCEEIQVFSEREKFIKKYIDDYLKDFNNPQQNINEYTDNIIRCLRLTKYIYIRGGGYYVDLEPRRMTEINSILNDLSGKALPFSKEEYQTYIGNYNGYTLPFESINELKKIVQKIADEIIVLEKKLEKKISDFIIANNVETLKIQIEKLRKERLSLQNELLKYEYEEDFKITEATDSLKKIKTLGIKPSIALEKWSNIALNIIDDATLIKPNSPLGDDNEPTFTAPSKVPDIECYYNSFQAICEVTMLTGRNQWFNEGQPVMRHLRDFENNHATLPNYCLFIAPQIHQDTINTFWTAVKYEYEGKKQKIIPITISELIDLLEIIRNVKQKGMRITHTEMMTFYNCCVELDTIPNAIVWRKHIVSEIQNLKQKYA
ncbi:MAG: AlwI family type II restriction endonuclease [Sphingobacteriia bacterium]|jgi:hypothetical protein|nr:AlwI family type II restriction endonuclease [Sphingobacteriia bacterium]